MSRYSGTSGRGHHCQRFSFDDYEISWEYDRYLSGSRLRWPTRIRRATDEKGARRFCKKWNIKFPEGD